MPVHAQSVIPTWVNNFDSAFYTSLTNQENSCYTRGGNDTFANWSVLWTSIATALNNWKNVNRQSAISDFITSYYSYYLLSVIYGSDSSLRTSTNSSAIFTIGTFIANTKARADNYYNDIVVPAKTSAKIAAELTVINGAQALEASPMNSLKASFQAVTMAQVNKGLFQDITLVAPSPTKAQMATEVFITRDYKRIYQNLNVGTLTLPPGV
jgi:hypothetical protein